MNRLPARLTQCGPTLLALTLCTVPALAQDHNAERSISEGTLVQSPRDPYVFIEQGPDVDVTYYADGSTGTLPTVTVWRPICGGEPSDIKPEEFRKLIEEYRQEYRQARLGAGSNARQAQGGGGALNLVFDDVGFTAEGQVALGEVESYIEGVFSDNLSFTVNINYITIGGGCSILGFAGSNSVIPTYSSTRDALLNDKDSDDTIQDWLPAGGTVPVRYDGNSSDVTDENRVIVSIANFRAAIGSIGGDAANISINSLCSWDFDPSNGVPSTRHDFQGVIVHEVGHAMGFTSQVDAGPGDLRMLDLFRFQLSDGCCDYNPDNLSEFQTTARMVDFNAPGTTDDVVSDLISVEYRMSDGSPWQASHFREQFPSIGIMDPAQGSGQTNWPDFFLDSDKDMLDAIGWDFSRELTSTTVPLADDFPTIELDQSLWTGNDQAGINARGSNEPSPPLSLNLNGNSVGGDAVRTAFMDTSAISDLVVQYWYEAGGFDDPPEAGEDLIVEYLNSSGQWVEINRHFADGTSMTDYVLETIAMPAAAQHSNFRMQFRSISDDENPGFDDWFVDDVCIGAAADCELGCQKVQDCDDGIDCTVDACESNECVHSPSNAACDDENSCTVDTCDMFAGCEHLPDVGATCTDDNPCTENESCDANGNCVGTEMDCSELDDPCNAGECNPDTGLCGQAPANEGESCEDNDLCTDNDVCADGLCAGQASCDDGNACTMDSCDPGDGACTNEPIGCPEGESCNPANGECVVSCPEDLDTDGSVRVPDLIILLGKWGPCVGCPGDLDGDGEVRVPDLIIMLAAWGPCS